jgi:hypothetical protein
MLEAIHSTRATSRLHVHAMSNYPWICDAIELSTKEGGRQFCGLTRGIPKKYIIVTMQIGATLRS